VTLTPYFGYLDNGLICLWNPKLLGGFFNRY